MAVEREIHRTFAAPGREVNEDSPGITGAPEEFSLDDLFL
jgi:hypothetical protein